MHKIKRASFFFRIIFQIAFFLLPVILAIFWWVGPSMESFSSHQGFFGQTGISFIPESISRDVIAQPMTGTTKILGFLVSLIPVMVAEFILYCLIQLFRLYERGEIFSLQNVNYIKKIGYALLIRQALNPVYFALISATLSWNNPVGKRFISVSFTGENLGFIVMALLIIVISWIMAEGCKLREEQQYTV